MHILEATKIGKDNPSVLLLIESLLNHAAIEAVDVGIDLFWKQPPAVDIVHFHWPDVLFNWKPPSFDGLARLAQHLKCWKKRACLVATIHDRYPHYRNTDISYWLYATVYSHMDGFIHRGQTSIDELKDRYPDLADLPHVIIPAGLNTRFPNSVTRFEARQQLKLPDSARVFLAGFGDMRHIEEGEQTLNGFCALRLKQKRLLIVVRKQPLQQPLRRRLFYVRTLLHPHVRFHVGHVPMQKVQYFINAADVFVIPRVQVLNSANLQLGFTFGKVVVGPDTGVVGEILRQTENPLFTPGNARSVARALQQAYQLSCTGYGEHNRAFAQKHWNWELLADQHVEFFKTVLKR